MSASTSQTTSAAARSGIPASIPFVDGELVALPSSFESLDHFLVNNLFQTCGLEPSSMPLLWHALGAQEGFMVSWCKPDGEELNRYKATGEFPIDVDRLQVLLTDVQNLKAINPQMVNIEVLRKLDENHQIVRIELKLPAFMANRELVVLMSFNKLSSGPHKGCFVVTLNSVNIAPYTALANPENVRAKIIRSGYVIQPSGEKSVHFTSVFEADLEGWLPVGMQNFVGIHGIKAAISSMAASKEEAKAGEAEKRRESNPDYSGLSSKTVYSDPSMTGKDEFAHGSVGGSTSSQLREQVASTNRNVAARR